MVALGDQATFLSSKVNFLLDATLGLINLEQNQIIKIFSVAAVVFLPPTLVASIYGMNFAICRSCSGTFGYPLAIGMMIAVGDPAVSLFQAPQAGFNFIRDLQAADPVADRDSGAALCRHGA